MKRVILAHGWAGTPEHGWFPWIRRELETKGFQTVAPELPDTENPRPEGWVPAIANAVGVPDSETNFIGHSLGCVAIAKYLETLPEGTSVGGVVYVAGFFKRLTNLESPDELETTSAWLSTPTNYSKVRGRAPKSVAIFSTNDPFVPIDNVSDFKEQLGSEILILPNRDHFSGDTGCNELPEALDALTKLAS